MAIKLTELFALLTAKDGGYKKGLDDAEAQAKHTAKTMDGIGKGLMKVAASIGSGLILGHVMRIEESLLAVEASLEITGQEWKKNTQLIEQQAQYLSEITGTSKEIYLASAETATYLGVSAANMGNMLRVGQGLAEIMGTDITQGIRAATQAQYGYYLLLQRRLPELRGMTDPYEKLAYVVKKAQLGLATMQVDSLHRAVAVLKQTFLNLVQNGFAPILPYLTAFINMISILMRDVAAWAKAHKTATAAIVGTVVALGFYSVILPIVNLAIKALALSKVLLLLTYAPEIIVIGILVAALVGLIAAIYKVCAGTDEFARSQIAAADPSPWLNFVQTLAGAFSWLMTALERVGNLLAAIPISLNWVTASIERLFSTPGGKAWWAANDKLNIALREWEEASKFSDVPFKKRQDQWFNEFMGAIKNLPDMGNLGLDMLGAGMKSKMQIPSFKDFAGGGLVNFESLNPSSLEADILHTLQSSDGRLEEIGEDIAAIRQDITSMEPALA